jgi:ribosomal protein S2
VQDIEPKGFDLIVMDGYLTRKTVSNVKAILETTARRANMVNANYDIAAQYYSYAVLRRWLNIMLTNFFGADL